MKKALAVFAIVFLIVLASVINQLWTLGNDSDDWQPVCVHGQLVYRANFAQKAMAVNALDEYGKSIRCEIK